MSKLPSDFSYNKNVMGVRIGFFFFFFIFFLFFLEMSKIGIFCRRLDLCFFFLLKVFQSESTSAGDNAAEVAESILNFFPGFDAFKLPPPSSDPDVVLNLNREEVQSDINKSFLRGVQEFKAMLLSKLSPKRSFQDGEYVTGEGKLTFYERQVHDELCVIPVL